MIALDTNIIVRFLVRDDEDQAQAVYRRFKQAEQERERLFVPLVVVLEVVWVLESAYKQLRPDILDSLSRMRYMPIFNFEQGRVVDQLLLAGRDEAYELSDLLIGLVSEHAGCETVLTFDKRVSRLPAFNLLQL